jgi:hypothetical protein
MINWAFGVLFNVFFTVLVCKLFPTLKNVVIACPLLILTWTYASNLFLLLSNLLYTFDISLPTIWGIDFTPANAVAEDSTFLDFWVFPLAVFIFSIVISRFFVKKKEWKEEKEAGTVPVYNLLKISFLGIILGTGDLYPAFGVFLPGDTTLPISVFFAILFTITAWELFPILKNHYIYVALCYGGQRFIDNSYDALSILISDGVQKLGYISFWLLQAVIAAIILTAVSAFVSMLLLKHKKKPQLVSGS